MSGLYLRSIAVLAGLAFSIIAIGGIMSGASTSSILSKGSVAALVTAVLWGLIGVGLYGLKNEDVVEEEEAPPPSEEE